MSKRYGQQGCQKVILFIHYAFKNSYKLINPMQPEQQHPEEHIPEVIPHKH